MKVVIAGATGAVGRPLVKRLIADGHEVTAVTQSEQKAQALKDQGAIPYIVDVMDADAVLAMMKGSQPEVVVNMLTSLPKQYTPEEIKAATEYNDRMRLAAGSNLLSAMQIVGARRYIMQSAAFLYEEGANVADESTPFACDAPPGIAHTTRIYKQLEDQVLEARTIEGMLLRFGFFYGPGTWYAKDGSMAEQMRQRQVPIVGQGQGIWSFVHIEDVTRAICGALKGPAGVYNITDDSPIAMARWLPAYARWLEAPAPLQISTTECSSPDRLYYATCLRGASNVKAKRDLGFKPRPLEWLSS